MVVGAEVLRVGEDGLEELQGHNLLALVLDGVDAGHAYVLYDAQVGEVLLTEGHPEAGAADSGEVLHQAFQLLVVHQIRVAGTDIGIGEVLMDFEGTGGNPFAVLVVAAVLGNLADVDFGVEVGGESLAVVAGVAVDDVEGLHGREPVLGGVGGEDAGDTRVEAAAEDGGQAGLLEALAVGPLPRIFEVSLVLGLIVGGVEVVDAGAQAGVHDGEILIRQGDVDDEVGLVTLEECHDVVYVVGVDAVGADPGFVDDAGYGVAFALRARSYDDLGEHIVVLSAFVGDDGAYTATAYDNNFCHVF